MKDKIRDALERLRESRLLYILAAWYVRGLVKRADRILDSGKDLHRAGQLLERASRICNHPFTARQWMAVANRALAESKDAYAAFTSLSRALDVDPGYAPAICPLLLTAEIVGLPEGAFQRLGRVWGSLDSRDREQLVAWLRQIEQKYEEVTRGRTLVYGLCLAGCEDVVRALLEAGAGPGARNRSDGETPLHAAAAAGRQGLAKLLLERGAAVDACGEGGTTPLAFVATLGRPEMAERLVSSGASVDRRDAKGSTPLFLASGQLRLGMVEKLLRLGADPNAAGTLGMTPLAAAMLLPGRRVETSPIVSTVLALLEGGADPCQPDELGMTPLMTAANLGFLECTRFLLGKVAAGEKGAEAVVAAWVIAEQEGHTDLAALLREAQLPTAPGRTTGGRVS